MKFESTDSLGELKRINPKNLIVTGKEDEVENFFLILGVFYNDLKSLTFHIIETNNKFLENKPGEISIKNGEYGGIRFHLDRLTIGILHEFFNFLKEKKAILKTGEFSFLYNKLNHNLKNKWATIVKISSGEDPSNKSDSFSKALLFIRNNLAFHYSKSAKVLRKGFIDFFYNDPKNSNNERAYYSIGNTMRDTRFFYCDAAAQRATTSQVNERMGLDEYNSKFREVIHDINLTIMALMKEYIRQRPSR